MRKGTHILTEILKLVPCIQQKRHSGLNLFNQFKQTHATVDIFSH